MASIKPKLYCVTGIDGCGKSTLVEGLSKQLSNTVICTIWDGLYTQKDLPWKSPLEIQMHLKSLKSSERTEFLMKAMHTSLELAFAKKPDSIILNAYIYKYLSSELALGADSSHVKRLKLRFPNPDVVFCMQIEPELAAFRKEKFTMYECGFAEKKSAEAFISFQKKCLPQWQIFDKGAWYFLDCRDAKKDLLSQCLNVINEN